MIVVRTSATKEPTDNERAVDSKSISLFTLDLFFSKSQIGNDDEDKWNA